MRQLTFEEAGQYAWREAPDPTITAQGQALVRPVLVACCDLDVAVARGAAPLPPGYAVGHEGLAEVVAVGDGVSGVQVGDRVVVPFQISCGDCRAVGPFRAELAALDAADRRVLVVGRQSIGLYATALAAALGYHVDYVD